MKKGTTLKSNIEKVYGAGPKQYQQGWSEFYKLKFKVTPDVLIPRPETELIVDFIVHSSSLIDNSKSNEQLPINNHQLTVMDLGTGSGCIAISVAKNLPDVKVIAIDISAAALEIAKQNAKFHKVEEKIVFLQADLLSFITPYSKAPDVITANLPYIPSANLMLIDPLVSEFEPKIALDGGQDGFDLYRKLFQQMNDNNFYPKILIIEIDDTHSQIAPLEAKKYFPNAKIEVKKDLSKIDRFLTINFAL